MSSDPQRLQELWRHYHLSPPREWFRFSELEDNTVLLDYDRHFSFHIHQSLKKIDVYQWPLTLEVQARVYMQTQLRGLSLTLDGREPLHATTLCLEGSTFSLVGDSGRGKSTLAAALIGEGAELVSDDLLIYDCDDSVAKAQPADPLYFKLFPEAWRRLVPKLEPLATLNRQTHKMIFEMTPKSNPPPLRAIYVLGDSADLDLKPMTPLQAYLAGAENVFSTVWWNRQRAVYQFENLRNLARAVPFFTLDYRREWSALKPTCQLIISHLAHDR